MGMFDDKTKKKLAEILDEMKNDVKIVFFTSNTEKSSCKDTNDFLDEIKVLTHKISIEKFIIENEAKKAEEYNIDKVPAIILVDNEDKRTGVRYFGLPGGYEINSFVKGLIEVSGKKEAVPVEYLDRISKINKKVHIQVFVSMACPYCPGAVLAAHTIALGNNNVISDMIDSSTFIHLSEKYSVGSVPKTVINERYEFIGARPIGELLKIIENIE